MMGLQFTAMQRHGVLRRRAIAARSSVSSWRTSVKARGRERAMAQFLDEKTYRPGFGAYERGGAPSGSAQG